MVQTELLCLPERAKSNIFTVLVPVANTTNNDQFRVNAQNLWSCLIKHNGRKKRNSRQPEWKVIYEHFLKSSTDSVNQPKLELSLYKPFRSSSKAVYDFAEQARVQFLKYYNRWSCGSALQMPDKNRLESPLGVWTNPE